MKTFKVEDFVDPNLAKALAEWKDFYNHSMSKAIDLSSAYTPVKDAMQAGESFMDTLKQAKWQQPDMDSLMKTPSVDPAAYSELSELHTSTVNKLWEHYTQSLKTTQSYGEKLADLAKEPKSPQTMMATYLSSTLDAFKQYQDGINAQLATLGDMQSAYKGWFEKNCLDKTAMAPAKAPVKAAAKKEPAAA
ncbi:MAG: hypothetical protein VX447_02810 [Pseudomonadota bacterium]|uniref:hypothetical protein n=1 Tax=Gallaecimonas pentaromativorans TaxID=584787 RepID=UPI00067F1A95|nr:hypothetical protein [Gallaecimonas pentaromativorans]MED5523675.1 hypothetical protein [Pseudomonadota bacterium]